MSETPFTWTDQLADRAKNMWLQGATANQIALDVGAPSRNAVIGKLTRMGVQRPAIFSIQNGKLGGKRSGGGKTAKPRSAGNRSFAHNQGQPKPPQLAPIRKVEQARGPEPLMVPLIHLSAHTCKWPIGDLSAGGGFCGNRTAEGGPYCGFHRAKAYQPPSAQNDAKALIRSLRRYA